MGFAPGAAIGAKLGAPDRKVICLVGDGGLLSAVGAFATAVELGVPVVFVVFNNFCFSTIRSVGTTYFNNSYGTEFTTPDGQPYNPDFPLLAKAFGMDGDQVIDPDDLAPALRKAFARERALPARSADARGRADAAHRILGHRGISEARERLTRLTGSAAGFQSATRRAASATWSGVMRAAAMLRNSSRPFRLSMSGV